MNPQWLPEDACDNSRYWLASLPANTTPQQLVDLCPDADWLLWLAEVWHIDCTAYLRVVVLRIVRVHTVAGLRFSGLSDLAETLAAVPDDIELPALLEILRQVAERSWAGAWTVRCVTLAARDLSQYQGIDGAYITTNAGHAAVEAAGHLAGPEWIAEGRQQLEDARKMLGPALIQRAGEVQ